MGRRRILLLGAEGQLGSEVVRAQAASGGPIDLVPLNRRQLDLAQPDALAHALADASFHALVNCAAYHDTDEAEAKAALAFEVNGHAVQRLAQICAQKNARFLHISTDYVFGGDITRRIPLTESDPAAPVNVYGASKALGETLATLALEDVVIFRVASLFGAAPDNAARGNFVETIVHAAKERGTLQVVDDQVMSPTSTTTVAAAILRALTEGCPPGTYHVVNTGAISWFGFATSIVRRLGLNASVSPCPSDEMGRRAMRPAFSALDNAKASADITAIDSWQDALGRYFHACGYAEKAPLIVRGAARQPATARPLLIGANPSGDSAFVATETLHRRTGNLGNLAFLHAIDQHLGPRLKVIGWREPLPEGTGHDLGVVPAANQLGRHGDFGYMAKRFESLDIPLVMIGLGAQSNVGFTLPEVAPGTVTWLHRVVERAPGAKPNLGVRGAFTQQVLGRYGLADHAVVVGCPSLFINPSPTLGLEIAARIRPPERIAVVAGHQEWRHLRHIEQSLARLVTRTKGSYIGQDPLEMVMLTRGEAHRMSQESLQACRDFVCPDMTMEDFIRWSARHGQAFFAAAAWMEHCRRFDLVVGTRIHGVMFALQAGVPALCIAHDSRTLELCQTMQVPHVLAQEHQQGIAEHELLSLLDFDGAAFDDNRRSLCARYVAFLEDNGLRVADWVRGIAQPPVSEPEAVANQ